MTKTPIDSSKVQAPNVEARARTLGERLRSAELPELERERIEDLLLADDRLFEQVLVAEEELIDAQVAEAGARNLDRIPDAETRLAFARALHQVSGPRRATGSEAGRIRPKAEPAHPRRLVRWAVAAAVLALATPALWWTTRTTEEKRETAVYVLSPASTRGASLEAVLLPPATRTVELWLEVSDEIGRSGLFAAELAATNGEILLRRESLHSEMREWGRVVVLEVQAADLMAGHYRIHLRAGGADGAERLIERYNLDVANSEAE